MRKFLKAAIMCAIATTTLGGGASAYTYSVIHNFCKKLTCGDGFAPGTTPIADQTGNLYGTALSGANNGGLIYELSPAPGKKLWKYQVLYNFCSRGDGCDDGLLPDQSTLILDTSGSLYGTTSEGGLGDDAGTIFKLSPNAARTKWTLTVIHSFCFAKNDCSDGRSPQGGLTYAGAQSGILYDGVSPLYGSTFQGGRHFGGVVYSLVPGPNGKWSESVIYAFCTTGGKNCADGAGPAYQLAMDSAGNLYGVSASGGAGARGVIFKLAPQIGEQRWTETVLHSFCSLANCADGSNSLSGLVADASGNLFGTAWNHGGNGGGVLFQVTPDGSYSVVHDFCDQENCADGSTPLDQGGLFIDPSGHIYGTTNIGGKTNNGTVFEFDGTTLNIVQSFCAQDDCGSGRLPRSGVLQDSSGNLFGTTQNGGKYPDNGVAFQLSP